MLGEPDVEDERGKYLSRMGFMCVAVSAGDLLRKEQFSSSARTVVLMCESICRCSHGCSSYLSICLSPIVQTAPT